jgi:hypothetical protein
MSHQNKNLFLIVSILSGLIVVSCGQKKTQNKENRFIASIDLTSSHENTIQLFYKINTDDRYYEAFSQKKKIKGSNSLQHLSFELPYGIKPKNIRIDLGEKEDVSIKLENILFQYKNSLIKGDKGAYKSWFTLNENIIEGKDSLTFYFKRVNNLFDPQLNGNRKLNAKLAKLFLPDIYDTNPFNRNHKEAQKNGIKI